MIRGVANNNTRAEPGSASQTPDIDYCIQKSAPPGSTLHYASLLVDEPHRGTMLAAHTLRAELHAMVTAMSDASVARRKLGWWAEELNETLEGRPRHPVSRLLLPATTERPERTRSLLHRMVNATGAAIGFQQAELDAAAPGTFASGAAYREYLENTAGNAERLIAETIGYRDVSLPEACAQIGVGRALVERILAAVTQSDSYDQLFAPDELAASETGNATQAMAAIAVEAPVPPPPPNPRTRFTPDLGRIMRSQARSARSALEQTRVINAEDARAHRSCLALAAMDLALLRKLEKSDWKARPGQPGRLGVKLHFNQLAPLTKLWISWRTDLRYR